MPTERQLQTLLEESIGRWNIPGASLAVLTGDEIVAVGAGRVQVDREEAITADTLLPFGSVTKTLTATLILHLVGEGRLGLDDSVTNLVPEFRPQGPGSWSRITVRHLLSHSSGLVGTIFHDTGWGEDAQAENARLISGHPPYFAPGALLSYCNSGILLLGRIVERVTGLPWHTAFREQLALPLGLESVISRPEDAGGRTVSIGHARSADGSGWAPTPYPWAFAGHSPAGSTPCGRATDLLEIVRLYLGEGPNAGYLPTALVREAWQVQQPSPVLHLEGGWGLGWTLFRWDGGKRVAGHDGATMATTAALRVDCDSGVAIALQVNTTNGALVYDEVFSVLFRELAGTWEPGMPQPDAGFVPEPERYSGVFEDLTGRLELRCTDGVLRVHAVPNDANRMPGARFGSAVLHNVAENAFCTEGEVARTLLRHGNERTRLVRHYGLCTVDGTEYFHNGFLGWKRVG